MLTSILIVIIIVLFVGFGVLFFFLLDLKKKHEAMANNGNMQVMMEWMKEMKQSTDLSRDNVQKNIHETNKAINERLDKAANYIGDLSKRLGEMTQIGPDIRRLSDVLTSPKTRGNFGEEMLENMLAQVLPKSAYQMQYRFKNGETVDAIMKVGNRLLPIDSKFSMENFRLMKEANTEESTELLKKAFFKDIKKRVDEIHKKYILPQEETFDFSLMYIPSEAVYSEVIDDQGANTYAREKKVYFVSPNTLYHHLQIILLSLRGQEINQTAQEILNMISGIKQESDKFGKNLDVLGNHIKNAGNTMAVVSNDFLKLKTTITNASSLKLEVTPVVEVSQQDSLLE